MKLSNQFVLIPLLWLVNLPAFAQLDVPRYSFDTLLVHEAKKRRVGVKMLDSTCVYSMLQKTQGTWELAPHEVNMSGKQITSYKPIRPPDCNLAYYDPHHIKFDHRLVVWMEFNSPYPPRSNKPSVKHRNILFLYNAKGSEYKKVVPGSWYDELRSYAISPDSRHLVTAHVAKTGTNECRAKVIVFDEDLNVVKSVQEVMPISHYEFDISRVTIDNQGNVAAIFEYGLYEDYTMEHKLSVCHANANVFSSVPLVDSTYFHVFPPTAVSFKETFNPKFDTRYDEEQAFAAPFITLHNGNVLLATYYRDDELTVSGMLVQEFTLEGFDLIREMRKPMALFETDNEHYRVLNVLVDPVGKIWVIGEKHKVVSLYSPRSTSSTLHKGYNNSWTKYSEDTDRPAPEIAHLALHVLKMDTAFSSARTFEFPRYCSYTFNRVAHQACLMDSGLVILLGEDSSSFPESGGYVEREVRVPFALGAIYVSNSGEKTRFYIPETEIFMREVGIDYLTNYGTTFIVQARHRRNPLGFKEETLYKLEFSTPR